ncbi:hypothetical protein [Streptomyces sp. NBC_01760]|uniref:hypothetical protein n=1 Tax=Streptomyces sp. NBC_01760 TaxID=2975931 RepID=UPI002DDC3526|nr:hypothetical protein [Streptomyces sp. NBC_01760]WSC72215.1 hypothetical protein OG807_29115 [Streptomyces sp. NBC_01760]
MDAENAAKDDGLLLQPKEAAMLAWFVVDGPTHLSIEEAAAKLGVSPDYARVLVSRAKSKLRLYAGRRWPLEMDRAEEVEEFPTEAPDAGPRA